MLFYKAIAGAFLWFVCFIGSVFGMYAVVCGVEWLTKKLGGKR